MTAASNDSFTEMVWNIWGRDCVVVHFKNGGTLWIGTDDADDLAEFLRTKVRA